MNSNKIPPEEMKVKKTLRYTVHHLEELWCIILGKHSEGEHIIFNDERKDWGFVWYHCKRCKHLIYYRPQPRSIKETI